jgi:periplasmic mercuric ion binding protein
MNYIKIFILTICFTAAHSINTYAQKAVVTDTITVPGVCGQCKERIENAAFKVKGVKDATWNKKTKLLIVSYNATKTNKQQICKAVANSGHNAGDAIASDATYNKLPACCAYKHGAQCND